MGDSAVLGETSNGCFEVVMSSLRYLIHDLIC